MSIFSKRFKNPIRYGFDKFVKCNLGVQIFIIFMFSGLLLLGAMEVWAYTQGVVITDANGVTEKIPHSYYDMYVHAVNPHYSDKISIGQQILSFIVYLIIGIGLSGVIFTSLVNLFERRKDKWENGLVDYGIKKNFVLVIGGHKMVPQLCQEIFTSADHNDKIILIQTSRRTHLP